MPLLLEADPSEDRIASYLGRSASYVAESEGEVIGVVVLLPTRPETVELVNVAVAPAWRGRGIGKQLVMEAIRIATREGYREIEVGTGNSSLDQLALYQKCGFRINGIEIDHFVRHYSEPIVENGIPCRDMVRLARTL
ncbi:putative N-acetyltransferase YvbK [compost metagenome]